MCTVSRFPFFNDDSIESIIFESAANNSSMMCAVSSFKGRHHSKPSTLGNKIGLRRATTLCTGVDTVPCWVHALLDDMTCTNFS